MHKKRNTKRQNKNTIYTKGTILLNFGEKWLEGQTVINVKQKADSTERRASDRKVAGRWFDSRTGDASLCPWEGHFTSISHWGQAVYPLVWPSLTKDLQIEPPKKFSASVCWLRQMESAWLIRKNERTTEHISFYCWLCEN